MCARKAGWDPFFQYSHQECVSWDGMHPSEVSVFHAVFTWHGNSCQHHLIVTDTQRCLLCQDVFMQGENSSIKFCWCFFFMSVNYFGADWNILKSYQNQFCYRHSCSPEDELQWLFFTTLYLNLQLNFLPGFEGICLNSFAHICAQRCVFFLYIHLSHVYICTQLILQSARPGGAWCLRAGSRFTQEEENNSAEQQTAERGCLCSSERRLCAYCERWQLYDAGWKANSSSRRRCRHSSVCLCMYVCVRACVCLCVRVCVQNGGLYFWGGMIETPPCLRVEVMNLKTSSG